MSLLKELELRLIIELVTKIKNFISLFLDDIDFLTQIIIEFNYGLFKVLDFIIQFFNNYLGLVKFFSAFLQSVWIVFVEVVIIVRFLL